MPSDSDGKLRLRDVIHYFPLEGDPPSPNLFTAPIHLYMGGGHSPIADTTVTPVEGYNSAFHFRFQLPLEGGDYIWLDVNDIDATGPSNRHLCQLDTLASSL